MADTFQKSRRAVLLAEDDMEMRVMLSLVLQRERWSVIECKHGVDLLTHVAPLLNGEEGVEYDLIVTDVRMPGVTGMEVVKDIAGLPGCPPIILITAFGDAEIHERASELGVVAILDKPFDMQDFKGAVHNAMIQSDLQESKGKPVVAM
jgi:CheY-like chemotaxis protein